MGIAGSNRPATEMVRKRATSLARLPGALPLVVGVLTFAMVWVGREPPDLRTNFDFDYLWTAGHAVWHGTDPYAAVREAVRQGTLRYPFYYPGTAAVLVAPLGALPHRLAVSLFTALGMALLVWSVDGWRRWIVVSAPAFEALLIGQWSPWLTAAVGLPWLGFVWAAKPTIGLSLFAGWPSRWALGSGVVLVTLSLILLPHWPTEWSQSVQNASHLKAPVQRVGGALLLLALLRWRRPEARMLGVLSLIPHTTGLYELLPLLLIPRTKRAFAGLMALSYLAAVLVYTQNTFVHTLAETLDKQWPYFLVLVYLPALVMVLWPESRSITKPPME
jgi:hypothetical protein